MNKGNMDCGVSEEFFLTFEVNLAHLYFFPHYFTPIFSPSVHYCHYVNHSCCLIIVP